MAKTITERLDAIEAREKKWLEALEIVHQQQVSQENRIALLEQCVANLITESYAAKEAKEPGYWKP